MPPPTKPPAQFMQELRDLLLAEGIFNLTMADIAERLKCSRRRLYEIAPTKEELFLRIADETLRSLREAGVREAAKYSTPSEKILAYFECGVVVASQMTITFLRDLDRLEAGRRMFDEHQHARVRAAEKYIVDGIADGSFAPCPPRFVAEVLFLVVKELRDPEFQSAVGLSFEQGLRETYKLVLNGLKGPGPSAEKKKSKAARL